jgi:hypothetical protein
VENSTKPIFFTAAGVEDLPSSLRWLRLSLEEKKCYERNPFSSITPNQQVLSLSMAL